MKNDGRFKKGLIPWNKGRPFERMKGKNNPKWKGGKKTNSQGYIMILKPTHPFCDKQGYVRRSHLIMEQKIGRYLTKEEIVHHKNGIKGDDRRENLKLFANNAKHIKHSLTKTFRSKTHKQCSHCFIIKPRTKFSPQKPRNIKSKHLDPHRCWCKKCCAKYTYNYLHKKS